MDRDELFLRFQFLASTEEIDVFEGEVASRHKLRKGGKEKK